MEERTGLRARALSDGVLSRSADRDAEGRGEVPEEGRDKWI